MVPISRYSFCLITLLFIIFFPFVLTFHHHHRAPLLLSQRRLPPMKFILIWNLIKSCPSIKTSISVVNSLAPGRSGCHFKTTIFNLVLFIGIFTLCNNNALRWMSWHLTDDKSVQDVKRFAYWKSSYRQTRFFKISVWDFSRFQFKLCFEGIFSGVGEHQTHNDHIPRLLLIEEVINQIANYP